MDDAWWAARRAAAEMLHRAGIEPRRSVPESVRPEVWQIAGPVYTIAKTLQEHGFIEARGLNPAGWRFKPGGLPPKVRAAYRWAMREYRISGTIWFEGAFERFATQVGDDWLAFRDEGDNARALPAIRWLVAHRNAMWRLLHGVPVYDAHTGREEPWALDGQSKWPRLADYVFALDQSIDRCLDVLRRSLIRDYLDGKLTDEVKRQVVDELQAHADSGAWDDPDQDMREVAELLGIDTSADVVPLFANDCQTASVAEVVK